MKLILQSVAILLATVCSLDSSISYTHSIGSEAYYYAFSSYCAESTLNHWPSDFKANYPPSSNLQQFELFDVITADDSKLQCFAGWDPINSRIVLAFRGSRMNVENWATNLNAQQTDYPNYRGMTNARVHAGFYDAVKDLEEAGLTNAITKLITAHPGADVFSTGHSLGGAMASIAALNLKMSETYRNLRIGEVDVVTFGMPRWANSATVEAYENYMRSSWRIVNGNDPFVTIPDGGDYQHVARQIQYKGSSSTEHWMCDGSGDDSNCFGNDVVDMLAFTLDIDDHTSYFGYDWTPMCDCDEGYWRDGHAIDACPSSHPDKDGLLCYENCQEGYSDDGLASCWEDCDGNEVGPVCVTQDLESRAKHTYGRGVGTIPDGCDPGWVEQNGLCHKACRSGYELHGLIGQCKEKCRSGYDDHGLTCYKNLFDFYFKDGYGTGSGIGKIKTWCPSGKENIAGLCYTHCKSGYTGVSGVCWEDCKSNEENDGAFCRIPLESHWRESYLRGSVPMQCADDEEQILFMCFPKCRDGFMSVGPHCSPDTCVTPTSPPTNAVDDGSAISRRTYIGHMGKQCDGSSTDILRDYIGTVDDCQTKCDEMNCIGFVRVNSGTFAGKCYFRGGAMGNAYAYSGDDRDCYIPETKYENYWIVDGHDKWHAELEPECKAVTETNSDQTNPQRGSNIGYSCCNLDGSGGSRPGCTRGNAYSYEQAAEKCAVDGKRLCSREEVENLQGTQSGCGFDYGLVWTSSPCNNDIVESLTVYVSDVQHAHTGASITISIWHHGKAYQACLHAPSRGEVYTLTEDNGLKLIESPDEMFDETTILVDNDETNAPIFDKMKFTTSNGDWYGWDSVCASLDKPFTEHQYGKVCSSDCAECPSTNMAEFDHICVDNEMTNGCGPSKQLLTLDDERPNEYVAAIWEDGSDVISESLKCPFESSRSRLLGANYQ